MRRNYGTGSITFDKSSNRISARIRIDGKIIKKTFRANRMQEAETWLKSMANGGMIAPDEFTVQTWLDLYIKNNKEKFLRPRSLQRVKQASKKWQSIGNVPLKKLKPMHIQKIINELVEQELSASAIKKSYEIMKSCLNQAVAERLIEYNPALAVQIPKRTDKRKIEILSRSEMGKVFHALRKLKNNKRNTSQRHDMILFFRILLYTGIRVSEALALTWANYNEKDNIFYIEGSKDIDSQTINQPKTEAGTRHVPLFSEKTKALLIQYKGQQGKIKKTDFIFSNKHGGAMNYQRAFLTWQKACQMAGIKKGIHSLRHTCISYLLTYYELPVATVSQIAGHTSPAITLSIYTHAIQEFNLKKRTHSGHIQTTNLPKQSFSWEKYMKIKK